MALDFPDSPNPGDTFSSDKKTWEWSGEAWDSIDVLVDNSVSTTRWDLTYTTVLNESAGWDSHADLTDIQATSGDWNSTYTTVLAESGDWEGTYTTVQSNSTFWDSNFCDEVVLMKELSSCPGTDTISISANLNLNGYSLSGVGNNSITFASGAKISASGDEIVINKVTIQETLCAATFIVSGGETDSSLWDSTYTTVSANSASWNTAGYDDTWLSIASGDWESTYTTVSANSAQWAVDTVYDDTPVTALQAASGDWESTYTTVLNESAGWDSHADLTDIQASSGSWDSTYTTVSANSASWDAHADLTDIQASSGSWDSTYTTVLAESADWESAYTTVLNESAGWDSHADLTDIQAASGNWDSTYTTTSANSAQWAIDTVYDDTPVTALQAASGNWESTYTTVLNESAGWSSTYNIIESETVTFTAPISSGVILVDASSGNVVANLPSAVGNDGKRITIKKVDGTLNTVTLSANTNIDGQDTFIINNQYDAIEVMSNNIQWYII